MARLSLEPDGLINGVYVPYITSTQGRQIFYGGSSSGKSCFLAQRVVLDVLRGRNYLIARNVARTLGKSVWNEVLKAIDLLGVGNLFTAGKTEMVITSKCNRKQILFAGLDDVEKIKSITPISGALTDIWIEEATEVQFDDYKQLTKRLRGMTQHNKRVTLSFNPIYKTHWIYNEFFKEWQDGFKKFESDDLLILKTTYKDNEFLTADDVKNLEEEADDYYRNVYTLGNWGVLGDVIFKNWKVEDLHRSVDIGGRTVPFYKTFDNFRNGLDFGFSQDPAAVVRSHLDKLRKKIYVFKEGGGRGMTNTMLAKEAKAIVGNEVVTCDSSEPKSIAELRGLGISASGALKGKDSVNYGIQWMQGYEIVVDTRCQNVRNEMTIYQWKQDKNGVATRQPADKDNHWIDALRYSLESDIREKINKRIRIKH